MSALHRAVEDTLYAEDVRNLCFHGRHEGTLPLALWRYRLKHFFFYLLVARDHSHLLGIRRGELVGNVQDYHFRIALLLNRKHSLEEHRRPRAHDSPQFNGIRAGFGFLAGTSDSIPCSLRRVER